MTSSQSLFLKKKLRAIHIFAFSKIEFSITFEEIDEYSLYLVKHDVMDANIYIKFGHVTSSQILS